MVEKELQLLTISSKYAKKNNKHTLVVVNKLDTINLENNIFEFYNIGLGDPIPISSQQGLGIGDLLDEVIKNFPEKKKMMIYIITI